MCVGSLLWHRLSKHWGRSFRESFPAHDAGYQRRLSIERLLRCQSLRFKTVGKLSSFAGVPMAATAAATVSGEAVSTPRAPYGELNRNVQMQLARLKEVAPRLRPQPVLLCFPASACDAPRLSLRSPKPAAGSFDAFLAGEGEEAAAQLRRHSRFLGSLSHALFEALQLPANGSRKRGFEAFFRRTRRRGRGPVTPHTQLRSLRAHRGRGRSRYGTKQAQSRQSRKRHGERREQRRHGRDRLRPAEVGCSKGTRCADASPTSVQSVFSSPPSSSRAKRLSRLRRC